MKNSQTFRSYIICLVASLFYFLQNIQATMFNSLNVPLMKTFSLSVNQISFLSMGYYLSNVLFLFIAGIFVDYSPRKKTILLACAVNIISLVLFSFARHPWQIFICHFVNGLAGTFSLIPCIRLASNWFSKNRLATITGLMVMVGPLGNILSQSPLVLIINTFNWHICLQVIAALGVVIFILIICIVREEPSTTHSTPLPKFKFSVFKKTLTQVLSNYSNLLLGICAAIANSPVFILGALWGNVFLGQVYGIKSASAGVITSMLSVGGMMGSFFIATLYDHLGKRKLIIQLCIVAAFLMIFSLFFLPVENYILLAIVFLLIGLFSTIHPVLFTMAANLNPKKLTSSAQGLVMNIMMMGGFLQYAFSYLLELNWDHKMSNGIQLFSKSNYQQASIIFLVGYLVVFLITFLIKNPTNE